MPAVNAHGYLLAWLKYELSGEWDAVITWTRITGDEPTYRRLVVTASPDGVRPMESPEVYRAVPRLMLTKTGTVHHLAPKTEPPPGTV